METSYYDCECGDFDHAFRFSVDPDDGDLTLEARLNIFLPWYKRVWLAILYVLGRSEGYGDGHYDVTVVREKDYARLVELIRSSSAIKKAHHVIDLTQEKTLLKG